MGETIKNYENLLKVFAELRKFGIITNTDITDWADEILASENLSDYEFIEISTTKNSHDLIVILEKNSQYPNLEIVCRAMLGILYHSLTASLEFKKALKVIHEISYEEKLTNDEQFLLYGFSEISMYDLRGNYEGFRLFKEDLMEFLKIYKDFTLTNYKEWNLINEILLPALTEKLEKINHNYPY
ncbi:hypothetical protein SAMN05421846_11052 [Chryseobacterium taeanense]|uniref:Uncharacterized protein n=1 Tax=Chryseobacterium taeanense TaxID=311334 RepID=A0A1G8LTT4_9FLAO|nr:hypothetical protein [Chryseobacterium taeanense]SDI59056.1 hypothetical protein SAMN05421846_11052 [Chryseobacterium taeanense]